MPTNNAVRAGDDPYSYYPRLRAVLDPRYAFLPPEDIEALMEGLFGPGAAENYEEDLEGIFDAAEFSLGDVGRAFSSAARDVGRFATKAAPVVANVGGGALKGALAGSALGLPGIIGGAVAGGVSTGLSSYAKGPARNIGNALGTATNIAAQLSPTGRVGGTLGSAISGLAGGGGGRQVAGAAVNALGGLLGGGGAGGGAIQALGDLLGGRGGAGGGALNALASLFGGSNAAGQLMSLLRRPETAQALGALGLGAAGRPTIPVGAARTPVPTSLVPGLIRHLSEQVVAEAAALSDGAESALGYMTDETGEYVGDPASEQDRAARLWDLLNEAQAERVLGAIYQETAESSDESAYCPHCGAYLEDIDGAYELNELYDFAVEDLGEDYQDGQGEGLPQYFYSEWDEDTPYEYA